MCYYNGQRVSREEFIRLKELEKAAAEYEFLDRELINGFAYGNIAVLKPNKQKDNFDIVQMEWGFLPKYPADREAVSKFRNGYKNAEGRYIKPYVTLNAKSENLFINEKGSTSMFADAAMNHRCLVLSTGFFEWQHVYPKNKKTGLPLKTAVSYPYSIGIKGLEYFYFAGIYQEWTDKTTGEVVETVAIITAPANGLMEQVHNTQKRMPTILNPDLAWEWLMEDINVVRISEIAATQYPASEMQAYTIAKEFRSSSNPNKAFIYEGLPALVLQ